MKATLKQWRGLRGMTQKELADNVGVTQTTVSLWENGEIPSRKNEKKLREILKLGKTDHIIMP